MLKPPALCKILLLLVPLSWAGARPMTVDDLLDFKRVGDPQLSPDGTQIVYVVTNVLVDENRTQSDLWLVSAAGGEPQQLTFSDKNERHPRWSPDGKWIAFESNRGGSYQIWLLPTDGGEAHPITAISTGANGPKWSPDGGKLAFVSSIYAEFSELPFAESDAANKAKAEAKETSKVKARVATQLLYRHWDSWVDDLRQHVFVVPVAVDGTAGEPFDATPGENDGVPTSSTFDAGDEYSFSADGGTLVFTAPPWPTREQAWSTNHDIWSVDLATMVKTQLTTNPAADGEPRHSPDGKWLAYRAQARPGFEADRWQLFVRNLATGETRGLSADFDSNVSGITWAPDSGSIFFEAEEKGTSAVWHVALSGGAVTRVAGGSGSVHGLSVSPDRGTIVASRSTYTQPPEVVRIDVATGTVAAVTTTNEPALAELDLNAAESVTVPGAGGTPVQMWVIKPPGFEAGKKYPLVFMVHGGPQGAWGDGWSTRWNPEVWAAQGYVLAMPNPRGSTGFGQQFTDEISRDWGGKVYEDLMACLAWLEAQPYVDAERMAAAGASYGGYMMNWFQGHTTKFKTLVTHCGVFNFSSMYGTTEETWFDEWEHGKPWEHPEQEEDSPIRYAANFKTPNLIIHNELDFRVPIDQGMSLFTALQRQGVPSKLVIFPDEGHWVLKPQNSAFWHETIFDWLAEYLK